MRLILAMVLLSSCATAVPSYTTSHGVKVFDDTLTLKPTQAEVEAATQYMVDALGGAEKLNGWDALLVGEWIRLPIHGKPSEFRLTDGLTDIWNKRIVAAVFQVCFADSGLPHELAHAIHDSGQAVPDWWHDDKEFWAKVKEIEAQMIADLCPKNYEPVEVSKDVQ